jgi:uncharacterized protein
MRIVPDANVFVAAFAARGLCESVFELCLDSHEFLLSEPLFGEVRRNLARKVKLGRRTITQIELLLRENGTVLTPANVAANACRDPGDLHILGLASVGHADYIVTGDGDLLSLNRFGHCRIVNPREFSVLVHKD